MAIRGTAVTLLRELDFSALEVAAFLVFMLSIQVHPLDALFV